MNVRVSLKVVSVRLSIIILITESVPAYGRLRIDVKQIELNPRRKCIMIKKYRVFNRPHENNEKFGNVTQGKKYKILSTLNHLGQKVSPFAATIQGLPFDRISTRETRIVLFLVYYCAQKASIEYNTRAHDNSIHT